jgi:opacity protein-like surface antigen
VVKRRALSGLAALTLFDIAAAQAQAQTPNWTGFYIGANAGYRWANVNGTAPYTGFPLTNAGGGLILDSNGNPTFPVLATNLSLSPSGGVAGFHGGYNYLYAPTYLMGWEVDINWGRHSQSYAFSFSNPTFNGTGSASFSATIDWSASIRGRFGYVNGPWMLYGTAGLSLLRVNVSGLSNLSGAGSIACGDFFTCIFNVASSSSFSSSRTLAGLVLGSGVEYLFAPSVTLRVEYLLSTYGNVNFGNARISSSFTDTGVFCVCTFTSTTSGPVSANVYTQVLRVGASLRIP